MAILSLAAERDPELRNARKQVENLYDKYEPAIFETIQNMWTDGEPLIGTKGGFVNDDGSFTSRPYDEADLAELVVILMTSSTIGFIRGMTGLDVYAARERLITIMDNAIASGS